MSLCVIYSVISLIFLVSLLQLFWSILSRANWVSGLCLSILKLTAYIPKDGSLMRWCKSWKYTILLGVDQKMTFFNTFLKLPWGVSNWQKSWTAMLCYIWVKQIHVDGSILGIDCIGPSSRVFLIPDLFMKQSFRLWPLQETWKMYCMRSN